nr:uncharacterized protein LOC129258908 [Lytechinus pictus]
MDANSRPFHYALFLLSWCDVSLVASQFVLQPTDVAVVFPRAVTLDCVFDGDIVSRPVFWHRYTGDPPVKEELYNTRDNRFFIAGDRNDGHYNLFINATRLSDSGLYGCSYGTASTRNATLTVLPTSWIPVCEKTPESERTLAGDSVELGCSSTGSSSTSLQWLRNGALIGPGSITRDDTMVSVSHFEIVPSDSSITFTCNASLPGLDQRYQCTLGPYPESDSNSGTTALIPFIIVGILSVVVILLFVIVLFILFRHRRCRFCQEQPVEPQMVLDAEAIAAGRGFTTIIRDDDDDDGDGGEAVGGDSVDNPTLSDSQPDLLSSIISPSTIAQKSPNSTLRQNMNHNRESVAPKKPSDVEKLRPSELRRMKKKRTPSSRSGQSQREPSPSVSSSASSSRDAPKSTSPVSVDHNITPRSTSATSIDNQIDQSQPGTSQGTNHSGINNLDASVGRKNRFTRKKNSRKSSSPSGASSTSPRNISEPGSSATRQSDSVIYAELDFSKNVGMNILGDEHL